MYNMRGAEWISGNAVTRGINLPHVLRKYEGDFVGLLSMNTCNFDFATKRELVILINTQG